MKDGSWRESGWTFQNFSDASHRSDEVGVSTRLKSASSSFRSAFWDRVAVPVAKVTAARSSASFLAK
eukprot:5379399-Prymnesium_polylepis.1